VIGIVAGGITTGVAVLIDWLPDQTSEQREGIDFVFWMATWMCVGIFALVAAVIVYSVWKFRAPPDDDSDGPPIHGHTGLEIAWTAVPAILVIVLGVASAVVLAQNDRAAEDSIVIKVTAAQFAWRFEYPNGKEVTALTLPVGEDVVLELTANDVIHSFWVPEFGQKQDAVPGELTKLAITPNRAGEYRVICTELCGLGHALMRTSVRVVSPEEYETWLEEEGEGES
jgi:cytochrome c oxidase subunit 2